MRKKNENYFICKENKNIFKLQMYFIDGYLVNLQILCEVLEIEMIIFQSTQICFVILYRLYEKEKNNMCRHTNLTDVLFLGYLKMFF